MKKFQYGKFEGTRAWKILDSAVHDLVENGDLEERTPRRYVVGYLVESLMKGGINLDVISEGAVRDSTERNA